VVQCSYRSIDAASTFWIAQKISHE
jgi:hypothetical protein